MCSVLCVSYHNLSFCICHTQVALKQWQSSYESYDEAMDLFESNLGEDESPFHMNTSQSSTTGESSTTGANTKGASSYLGETMSRMIKGIWGGVEDDASDVDNANNHDKESVTEGTVSRADDLSSNQPINIDNFQMMENMTQS